MARRQNVTPKLDSALGRGLFTLLYPVPFEQVAAWASELGESEVAAVLDDIEGLLAVSSEIDDESLRVGIAKLLVAMLPASRKQVERELVRNESPFAHQFHFSLFSMLEQLRRHGAGMLDVPKLTGDYLRTVRSESGHAVMMAGEVLGEHPLLGDALEALFDVLRTARFVSGRLGAVHGLGRALARTKGQQRESIVEVLRELTKKDRSKRVSQYAKSVLVANTPRRPRR